ncbi:hypothetical protein [Streptomyces scabiei]|uniref:hypothetical protein n=1 Tax=Streptomyces scabiei TaxID=1930 RepID=UPI001B32C5A8|nr:MULTISPECIES: hypothetical protein [Streptomyces]MBP5896325.1 hypothetical protein [Streptomyces sp. LBUM 1481]MDX3124931.1 hypothetical protein [Streptomyces scabiei]MDX3201851.1 hypothetical protein [Streptomyces scabiei]MDX3223110.1 hypothetical protein [Streptomyces scabiei]MDX3298659.1 hypothetical protein [Streptomyces scabiei]
MSDERAVQALTLRLAGVDWSTVADKLGFADAADALEAASEVADTQYDGLPLDPLRVLEVLRYDRLQAAVWKDAMKGDLGAVSAVLNISDRRIRTLRLNQRSRDD